MDKIAVLIPCYNEEVTITKVIHDWQNALPEAVIYVYDNNSSDATALVASHAGAVVRHEYQQGKGNVIRRMFREIDAECYIMVDGDDTYPAKYGSTMVNYILERKADMVIGDRLSSTYYEENKRPFHNFGNDLVRFLVNHLFNAKIADIMTGYRAFSYEFVKTFPVLSRGFEIETEMTIHAIDKNMNISSISIDYQNRPEGSESKLNTYTDGFKVLRTIWRLHKYYRPYKHMNLIATILAVISGTTLCYGNTVSKKAVYYVIASICACFAVSAHFTGYVLDIVALENRRNFEAKRIIAYDKVTQEGRD